MTTDDNAGRRDSVSVWRLSDLRRQSDGRALRGGDLRGVQGEWLLACHGQGQRCPQRFPFYCNIIILRRHCSAEHRMGHDYTADRNPNHNRNLKRNTVKALLQESYLYFSLSIAHCGITSHAVCYTDCKLYAYYEAPWRFITRIIIQIFAMFSSVILFTLGGVVALQVAGLAQHRLII